MTSSNPLVSAIITTHNRADLLPRAIDSVIVQTYKNIELIVVDDGSTDETPEVIQKYKKQYQLSPPTGGRGAGLPAEASAQAGVGRRMPLRYIRNEKSLGAPAARNKGIEAATGEFIAGLDDDDEWRRDRISELVAAYSDTYSCVTSDTKMIYSKGEAVWKKKKVIDLETLLYTNQVGNQVLVRRDRLLEIGGFDENLFAAQDYDLWIRLCVAYGPVRNVQKPLQNIYMDHQGERITEHSSFEGYLQFYNKHKHRMNKKQRKYQLYKIRRAQGKPDDFREFLNFIPSRRYFKELKRMLADWWWK